MFSLVRVLLFTQFSFHRTSRENIFCCTAQLISFTYIFPPSQIHFRVARLNSFHCAIRGREGNGIFSSRKMVFFKKADVICGFFQTLFCLTAFSWLILPNVGYAHFSAVITNNIQVVRIIFALIFFLCSSLASVFFSGNTALLRRVSPRE